MEGKTGCSRRIRERNRNQFCLLVSGQLSEQPMLLNNQEDDLQSVNQLIVHRSQESPGTNAIIEHTTEGMHHIPT